MFMPGWTQILLVVVLLVLLFGKGKISDLMGDFAQGIKSFKKGLADEEDVADIKELDIDTTAKLDPSAARDTHTDAS